MKKNIRVKLINIDGSLEQETVAKYNEETDEYTYIENDELKTVTKFSFKTYSLVRRNSALSLEYNFKENETTIGKITVNELRRTTELNIETKRIIKEKNKIQIDFTVENQEMSYQIEVI